MDDRKPQFIISAEAVFPVPKAYIAIRLVLEERRWIEPHLVATHEQHVERERVFSFQSKSTLNPEEEAAQIHPVQ